MDPIDAFLAEHRRRNHSERTIGAYRATLVRLFQTLPTALTADRAAIRAAIQSWPGGAATRNLHLAALKGFYAWAVDEGLRPDNPVATLPTAKVAKRLPKRVSAPDVTFLLRPPGDTPWDRRDTAIIATLLATGLRVSELCALDVTDVSGDELQVIGKGNKERVVYLDDRALRALRVWLAVRPPRGEALFISRRGHRLSRQDVHRLVAQRGGGDKIIGPHALRHTLASELVEDGVDLESVRTILGHESLATTQKYLAIQRAFTKRSYQQARNERKRP